MNDIIKDVEIEKLETPSEPEVKELSDQPTPREARDSKQLEKEKMLIVMEEGVGNMVMLTPTLVAMKEVKPDMEIWVFGRQPALEILEGLVAGVIDEQQGLPDDFVANHCFMTIWSDRFRARYNDKELSRRFGQRIQANMKSPDGHESEYHFEIARHFGWDKDYLPSPKVAVEPIINYLKNNGLTPGEYICLCDNAADTSWERKRWQHYPALATLLLDETDSDIVLVGGKYEADNLDLTKYPESDRIKPCFDLNLQQTTSLLATARLVIGNDSGPVHLSAAMGTVTIALFGPTRLGKNQPHGNNVHVIKVDMPCSPCQYEQWWQTCDNFECLGSELSVGRLWGSTLRCLIDPENQPGEAVPELIQLEMRTKPSKLAAIIRHKDTMKWIALCLESVERVCDVVLVVDNGSTDGSLEYILERAEATGMYRIEYTEGLDEIRDRAVMQKMIEDSQKNDGITHAVFIDGDEAFESTITREMMAEMMDDKNFNAHTFRHCHHWGDILHYRIDSRWKPKHARIMWRLTPEVTITTDKHVHPEITRQLKGRVENTDLCIRHFGHADKAHTKNRMELYKGIDNPNQPNWSGRTYEHMADEELVELADWIEGDKDRNFGRDSMLMIIMHGNGDVLMATPMLEAVRQARPDLDISVLGLGKTSERNFKTGEIFANNPCIKAYFDCKIDYHPRWWNQELYEKEDQPRIQETINSLTQTRSFDTIAFFSLQNDRNLHRIDRFPAMLQMKISDRRMRLYPSVADRTWARKTLRKIDEWAEKHTGRIVSVHRWCGHPPKSWDWLSCNELCKKLAEQGYAVVLWDTDGREWFKHRKIEGDGIFNMREYAQELTVTKTAALMAHCDLHVGADSFPMHIASAMSIPIVAIFERTWLQETMPLNPDTVLLASSNILVNTPIDLLKQCGNRVITGGVETVSGTVAFKVAMSVLTGEIYVNTETEHVQTWFGDEQYLLDVYADDIKLYIDPDDKDNKKEDGYGSHSERRALDIMAWYVENGFENPPITFLDIGANVGLYSLWALGQGFEEIHAFEPEPHAYKLLEDNLVDEQDKVTLYPIALTDREATAYINHTPRQSGTSFISFDQRIMSTPVKTITLDSLELRPQVVKIDVEGSEDGLITGAFQTLASANVCLVETHLGVDVVPLLRHVGFEVQRVGARHLIAVRPPLEIPGFPLSCLFDREELSIYGGIIPDIKAIETTLPDLFHDGLSWFSFISLCYMNLLAFDSTGSSETIDKKEKKTFEKRRILFLDGGATTLPFWFATQGHDVHIYDLTDKHKDLQKKAIANEAYTKLVNESAGSITMLAGDFIKHPELLDGSGEFDFVFALNEFSRLPDDSDTKYIKVAVSKAKILAIVTCGFGAQPEGLDYRIYDEQSITERLVDPLREDGWVLAGHTDFKNVDLEVDEYMAIAGEHTLARLLFERKPVEVDDEIPLTNIEGDNEQSQQPPQVSQIPLREDSAKRNLPRSIGDDTEAIVEVGEVPTLATDEK